MVVAVSGHLIPTLMKPTQLTELIGSPFKQEVLKGLLRKLNNNNNKNQKPVYILHFLLAGYARGAFLSFGVTLQPLSWSWIPTMLKQG